MVNNNRQVHGLSSAFRRIESRHSELNLSPLHQTNLNWLSGEYYLQNQTYNSIKGPILLPGTVGAIRRPYLDVISQE